MLLQEIYWNQIHHTYGNYRITYLPLPEIHEKIFGSYFFNPEAKENLEEKVSQN